MEYCRGELSYYNVGLFDEVMIEYEYVAFSRGFKTKAIKPHLIYRKMYSTYILTHRETQIDGKMLLLKIRIVVCKFVFFHMLRIFPHRKNAKIKSREQSDSR